MDSDFDEWMTLVDNAIADRGYWVDLVYQNIDVVHYVIENFNVGEDPGVVAEHIERYMEKVL